MKEGEKKGKKKKEKDKEGRKTSDCIAHKRIASRS
jgi:hypothetical protein